MEGYKILCPLPHNPYADSCSFHLYTKQYLLLWPPSPPLYANYRLLILKQLTNTPVDSLPRSYQQHICEYLQEVRPHILISLLKIRHPGSSFSQHSHRPQVSYLKIQYLPVEFYCCFSKEQSLPQQFCVQPLHVPPKQGFPMDVLPTY